MLKIHPLVEPDRREWPDTSQHCPGSWPGIYAKKWLKAEVGFG
jgi:hypothetical protein